MKPTNVNFLNFYKQQIVQSLCERLKTFYGRCASLFVEYWLPGAPIQLRSLKLKGATRKVQTGNAVAAVSQGHHLNALVISLKEFFSNKRLVSGAFLITLGIPSWICYQWFGDPAVRLENFWSKYYVNWTWYLITIRPYLTGFFVSTGFFIALPQKWAYKWWLIPTAFFCASELYRVSVFTNYSNWYTPFPWYQMFMPSWQALVVFILAVPAFYLSMNYTLYRKYHLKDGTVCRVKGIVQAPKIQIEVRYKNLESLIEESENFNARI